MIPTRDRPDLDATVPAQDAPSTPARAQDATPQDQASRGPIAMVLGTGQHFTDEVHRLLRQRLRIACSIALFGLGAFLLFTFWKLAALPRDRFDPEPFDIAMHAVVVAILTVVCTLLWSHFNFGLRTLRILELVTFGSIAVFFASLQFRVYYPAKLAELVNPEYPEGLERILELANAANMMRWFFLIVLYGMFIPNTWRRCAAVVGCMAAIPIVLTFAVCPTCTIMGPHTTTLLLPSLIILTFSAAMAIFGSYRISELQQEAYKARKLGQYQLKEKLGSGGMGEVYLGEHMLLKRVCAIKLIRPEQAGDPTTLSRFEREVQAMAGLTHWNTVEVYDYGHTEDGTFYYVMEYLPGLSLQELVDQHGPLPAGRAIHFLRQICGALREAHSVCLIHRDIKPSNVIVCQRGGVPDVAKLLDFGLVQDLSGFALGSDKLTMQGAILGSPNFISPEQAAGKKQIDARTDIYSLGAVGYFLVTGHTPFARETAMQLLAAHMKDEVTPPRQFRPEIPQDLEEVILMCLRKNPDDRFSDTESLELALAACDDANMWDEQRARAWWQQAPEHLATAITADCLKMRTHT
jgi:tRNA A-37 threonylcarbamoyl transferase component Bud32